MKRLIIILFLLVLAFLLFGSCEKEPDPTPYVEFIAPTEGYVGVPITFDASNSVNVETYYWDWDCIEWNNFDIMTYDPIITHTFHCEGTFNVRLQGNAHNNWSNIMNQQIIIYE